MVYFYQHYHKLFSLFDQGYAETLNKLEGNRDAYYTIIKLENHYEIIINEGKKYHN